MTALGGVHIVTGGTQGLGQTVAQTLARAGAEAVTICGRQEAKGRAVARALEDLGAKALFVAADLADPAAATAVVEQTVEAFGRVDSLCNAAASTARDSIADCTAGQWDDMMALNVRAPMLLMQAAVADMRRRGEGGSIVNILSVSAHGGQPKLMSYCTSKGALLTLTKNVAYAVRGDRIRVNALNIGWMATPAEHEVQRREGSPDDWLERADAAAPFGRILRPEDVAAFVAFLVSDQAKMTTGAVIELNQEVVGAFD